MKLLALPIVGFVLALVAFPVVFATGDNPGIGCAAGGDVAPILATIRTLESGGGYTARAAGSSASGAYQFIDSTWANYGGYAQAWQAPPAVQDAKAAENVRRVPELGIDIAFITDPWGTLIELTEGLDAIG